MRPSRTVAGTRRLFYALWPDEVVRGQLARIAGWCQHRSGGRQVAPENLHLTLLFLGELTAPDVGFALRAGAAVPARAFRLTLDRVEYWPRASLLAATTSSSCAPLTELVRGLRSALARRVPLERQEHVAHVTLVRKVAALAELPIVPIEWAVQGHALIESTQRDGVRRYEPLAVWPVLAP